MILRHKKAAEFGLHLGEISQIHDVDSLIKIIKVVSDKYSNLDVAKERDLQNSAKGDLFEVFGEYLIRTIGGDALLPIDREGYNPNNPMDGGVDGFGTYNNNVVVVQFKYRNPWSEPNIEYSQISNFIDQAQDRFQVERKFMHERMMVITTAKDFNEREYELRSIHPLLINYDTLKLKVGANNPEFWVGFVESIKETWEKAIKCPDVKPMWQHQQEAIDAGLKWLI
jgi:hypothetical protein